MVEFEADDALALGAAVAARDKRVRQVFIYTPDKDLAQCLSGMRVMLRRAGLGGPMLVVDSYRNDI